MLVEFEELQAILLRSKSNITLEHSSYVRRATNAFRWSETINKNGQTKLLLTPTVQMELSNSPQVGVYMHVLFV